MPDSSPIRRLIAQNPEQEQLIRKAYRYGFDNALMGFDGLDDEPEVECWAVILDASEVERDPEGFIGVTKKLPVLARHPAYPEIALLFRTTDDRDLAADFLHAAGFGSAQAYGIPAYVKESQVMAAGGAPS